MIEVYYGLAQVLFHPTRVVEAAKFAFRYDGYLVIEGTVREPKSVLCYLN